MIELKFIVTGRIVILQIVHIFLCVPSLGTKHPWILKSGLETRYHMPLSKLTTEYLTNVEEVSEYLRNHAKIYIIDTVNHECCT